MILVDTSVWVEFLKEKEPYCFLLTTRVEDGEVVASEIVFAELLQGAKNNRERKMIWAYWDHLPKLNEAGFLVRAGSMSAAEGWLSKGVGLLDAALIVCARANGLKIWTLDKKLMRVLKKNEQVNL